MAAVEEAGIAHKTFFFLTSDHGDMRMEHQQFYKMVPWEASARVPLVVVGPGVKQGLVVDRYVSMSLSQFFYQYHVISVLSGS